MIFTHAKGKRSHDRYLRYLMSTQGVNGRTKFISYDSIERMTLFGMTT